MRLTHSTSAFLAASICVSMAGATAVANADITPRERPRPIVLMLHAGGFIFNDPTSMAVATQIARDAGFQPVFVDYPLYDLRAAVEAAAAAAAAQPKNRTVCAYGESAGGTLAALLAERGLVRSAAAYSPIPNLVRFIARSANPHYYMEMIHADRELLLRDSPGLHRSAREILALRAARDDAYVRSGIRRWAKRESKVQVRDVGGEHIGSGNATAYRRHVIRAVGWLRARCLGS